ncbi:MAG TPA: hypothetical protein VI942_02480 [Thermoanaerobaculia bacterium]|nr:hypothetical protein [Thermoanaerobaculia bacterium]
MNRYARISGLALVLVAALGCEQRTDKTDDGGIILSISDFDGLPISISASESESAGVVQVGEITVQSIAKNSSQPTSALMRVEIDSYEVTFSRDDSGSRVPPRLKNYIFGTVDPGGTFSLQNGPIMRVDQFNNQPLKDMIEEGFDTETGSTVIRLKVGIQFFGRTISGDVVQSQVAYFTVEVFP